MNTAYDDLLESLDCIVESDELEQWVRSRLRRYMPHAAFLITLGKLYGYGSLPTHRIGVDFPLNLVEGTKTRTGAIDDPLACSFLQHEKVKTFCLHELGEKYSGQQWLVKLQKYGVIKIVVFGLVNREQKRFSIFQLINPLNEVSRREEQFLQQLSSQLAKAAWQTVDVRGNACSSSLLASPTTLLTSTELSIVGMLALGLSNKEIARRRGVSASTIKTQVSRTGAKLGASRRSEIVAVGMPMLGLLPTQGLLDYDL